MEILAYIVGSSLPLSVMVFVGSYLGIWKRNDTKLSLCETVGLFFVLWLVTAVLCFMFRVLLAGQDELTRLTIGNLLGPLVIGIIVGRTMVSWRRKAHAQATLSPASKDT